MERFNKLPEKRIPEKKFPAYLDGIVQAEKTVAGLFWLIAEWPISNSVLRRINEDPHFESLG